MEREKATEQTGRSRLMVDLRRRRRVWLSRAAAARLTWESVLRVSELYAAMPVDDPLRVALDHVTLELADLIAELEATAGIAAEEIAAWRRQDDA